MPLRALAHARAGDKGNTSSISVWANQAADYPLLEAQLTAERVATELAGVAKGPVRRYVLPHLHGLNFVLEDALEGGVNGSLNLDSHGKSWSYLLLRIELEVPDDS